MALALGGAVGAGEALGGPGLGADFGAAVDGGFDDAFEGDPSSVALATTSES